MKTHRVRQKDELHAAYYAALSVAWFAAWYAAMAAAWYAARSAAAYAEFDWQAAELIKMLEEDAQ